MKIRTQFQCTSIVLILINILGLAKVSLDFSLPFLALALYSGILIHFVMETFLETFLKLQNYEKLGIAFKPLTSFTQVLNAITLAYLLFFSSIHDAAPFLIFMSVYNSIILLFNVNTSILISVDKLIYKSHEIELSDVIHVQFTGNTAKFTQSNATFVLKTTPTNTEILKAKINSQSN